MSLHLTPQDIAEVTGFKRSRKKQIAELTRQNIPFRIRHDGFPLVLVQDYTGQAPQRLELPDFSGLVSANG